MAVGSDALVGTADACNPLGLAADLTSSYYASNFPVSANITGSRFFWANSLGTIYADTANVFAAATVGLASPGVGTPLQ
jgi:hypothetical protein